MGAIKWSSRSTKACSTQSDDRSSSSIKGLYDEHHDSIGAFVFSIAMFVPICCAVYMLWHIL